jgi:hypothetical protein
MQNYGFNRQNYRFETAEPDDLFQSEYGQEEYEPHYEQYIDPRDSHMYVRQKGME